MREYTRQRSTLHRGWPFTLPLALVALLVVPSLVLAHVERPAYWPDPTPDKSVHPAAGGKVPKARSLASALDASKPGKTLVVCKPDSLDKALGSIHAVETNGYKLRPMLKRKFMSDAKGDRLASLNRRFFARCALPLDPEGGIRRSQQRPDRRDAGRLRGAPLAQAADERSRIARST